MKRLLKRKVEKSYLLLVGVVSIFLIVGYFSYAYFTLQTEKANVISIKAGTLVSSLTSTDSSFSSNKITVASGTTKEIVIKLSNNNSQDAKFNFYYIGNLASGVVIGYKSGTTATPSTSGVVISKSASQSYTIIIKNTSGSAQTITFGSDAGLSYNTLTFPSNGHVLEEVVSLSTSEFLTKYLNTKTYENSSETERKNMYTFTHTAGAQQAGWSDEDLKDYRYIGQDPNNYVTFNGENAGWRIIGIFTVEDGNGKKEKRIKLIRKDFLQTNDGQKYISFDNKPSGTGSSESEYGSNDWTDARLMYLLNPEHESEREGVTGSIYWKQGSGLCPMGQNNGTKSCDFTTTGLNEEARKMIGDTKWYLGGSKTNNDVTTEMFYERERGTETCTTTGACQKTRQIFWVGKVGLMYPSDYGYATGGGSTINRATCLAKELFLWNQATDCTTNDWLYDNSTYQWAITSLSNYAYNIFYVDNNGFFYGSNAYNLNIGIRPVVYLSSDIRLFQGTGTSSEPFVFGE